MVGVDKDRKEKIVGDMIQRDVPLMMSHRSAYAMLTCSAMPMMSPMMLMVSRYSALCEIYSDVLEPDSQTLS